MENKEELTPIDMLLDDNNTEPITLTDQNGNEQSFEQVALIPMDEEIYAILKPITPIEGVGEDEALVFVIGEDEDEEFIEIVTDDKIIDKVFDEYYKLVEEEEAKN